MYDAKLHGCLWEDACNGIRKTFESIYASNEYILNTSVLEVGKYIKLEVGTLAFGDIHA